MSDKKSANTQKRKPPKTAWKEGQSGNPAGAPKRGQSWAELFNSIGELTGGQASERALKLWVKQFRAMPEGVTLKELVVIRAYAALLDESNARLLKEVIDRADGPVVQKIAPTDPSGENPYMNMGVKELLEIAREAIDAHQDSVSPNS